MTGAISAPAFVCGQWALLDSAAQNGSLSWLDIPPHRAGDAVQPPFSGVVQTGHGAGQRTA